MPPCTLERRDRLIAGAGQTVFIYTFEIFDQADITVWQEIPPAAPVELTITVDYTVQGVGGGAKTITLVVPASVSDIITLEGHDAVHARETTFSLAGPLRSADVNKEFDNLLNIIEELARDRCRTIRFNGDFDFTGITMFLGAPAANRAIGWNLTADGLETINTLALDTLVTSLGSAAAPSVVAGAALTTGLYWTDAPDVLHVSTNGVERASFADALITLIPNVQMNGNLNVAGTITGIFTVTGLSLADDEFIEFGTGDDFLLGYVAASNILALQDGPSPGANRFVFTPAGLASFGPNSVVAPLDVLHLINMAADSDVLTRYVNDVQAWRTGVLGSAADAYVIRDETNTATALSIAPSTLAATFSGTIGAAVAILLTNTAAPGGLGIWAFDVTAGGSLRGLDDSPSGAPLVWLQVNHTVVPAITDVLIQATRLEQFRTTGPPDFNLHSAFAHGLGNIGSIQFEGEDDGANVHNYIILRTTVLDDTDGSEAADFTIEAGAITVVSIDTRAGANALVMNATEYVLNEAGVDRNIRFESVNRANCLLIDAGLDTVTIDGDFGLGASGVNTAWHVEIQPGTADLGATNPPARVSAQYGPNGNTGVRGEVLAFDQTTPEFAHWFLTLPQDYDGRAITVRLRWSTQASSGTVQWRVYLRVYGDSDTLNENLSVTATITPTADTVEDVNVDALVFTPSASARGQLAQLILERNPAADSLAADAQFIEGEVAYT